MIACSHCSGNRVRRGNHCSACSGTGVYMPQSQLDRVRGGIQALLKLAMLEGDVSRFGLEAALRVVDAVEESGMPREEAIQ